MKRIEQLLALIKALQTAGMSEDAIFRQVSTFIADAKQSPTTGAGVLAARERNSAMSYREETQVLYAVKLYQERQRQSGRVIDYCTALSEWEAGRAS